MKYSMRMKTMFFVLLFGTLLFSITTCFADDRPSVGKQIVYDNSNVKDAVAILAPEKHKIYFALYANALSPTQKAKIRETKQLDSKSKGSEYKVVGYIQLELKPGTEKITLSDVIGYTMEFNATESWAHYWKEKSPPANFNWSATMKDGVRDLSPIKKASGNYKVGEKALLSTAGEKNFLVDNDPPPFKWNLDLNADILFAW